MAAPVDPRQRNQLLYPFDDPSTAFDNALRDVGVNPFRSNPFVAQLQKAAPGARIAFLGNTSGNTAQARNDPSGQFGQWLQSQIGGGSLLSTLSNTASGFNGILQRLKNYQDAQAQGMNPTGTDPYMAGLNDILGANGGMGSVGAYASLRTPLMGALGQPYSRALQNSGDSAMRRFYQSGGLNDSPFDWLFSGQAF
jgi:hypothetical protein